MHYKKKKKEKKRKLWLLTAQSCTFEHTHAHTNTHTHGLIQAVNWSLLRCLLSPSAGLGALILAETSQAVETWLLCSLGIDRTGVPRRWQGQQLIGPKWEWRGGLIAIDPLVPPAGSSIFDYDHFTPNQVHVSCDGGKSHREVLAPFAKAVIMRGSGGPRSMCSMRHQAGW